MPKEIDDPWIFDDAPRKAKPVEKLAPIESCERMRAVVSRSASGQVDRLYLSVMYGGQRSRMAFDTGSPVTRLTHDSTTQPRELTNAGVVKLFCEDQTLGSLPQSPLNSGGWRHEGMPVIGTL